MQKVHFYQKKTGIHEAFHTGQATFSSDTKYSNHQCLSLQIKYFIQNTKNSSVNFFKYKAKFTILEILFLSKSLLKLLTFSLSHIFLLITDLS